MLNLTPDAERGVPEPGAGSASTTRAVPVEAARRSGLSVYFQCPPPAPVLV